jgi:hypothetical protein
MEEENNQDFISKRSPLSCFLCVMYISEIHRKEEIYLIDNKKPFNLKGGGFEFFFFLSRKA